MNRDKNYHFFAILSRMKHINRWGLMRNTRSENLSEHSLDVSIIAHALAIINNKYFGGNISPERAALLGLFHDATEIITGDLPTPIKYYNKNIMKEYKQIEKNSKDKLLSMLPSDMREEYASLLDNNEEDRKLLVILKAADKISALIKCIEEKSMGNTEFDAAKESIINAIEKINSPEADYFMEKFLPSYSLTLDEQGLI